MKRLLFTQNIIICGSFDKQKKKKNGITFKLFHVQSNFNIAQKRYSKQFV